MKIDELLGEIDDYWRHWDSTDVDLSPHQFPIGH